MQVAEEDQLSLLMHRMYHFLDVVDDWMKHLGWHLPSTVEVAACQRTSIVTIDNSIRIEHRYDLEHEHVTKQLGLRIVGVSEEVEHSFHHPTAHRLTGMDSSCDDYAFLGLWLGLLVAVL